MKLVEFPQANVIFHPPVDLSESQCAKAPAYIGQINGGSCDGCNIAVVAWQPNEEDIEKIKAGGLIYLATIGGLPPHYLSLDFEQALRPA